MKGRKILPDEIKKLKGTDQPCRMRPDTLKIKDLVNLPTPHKSLKGEALSIYKVDGLTLLTAGILNSINLNLFTMYCFWSGLTLKYQNMLNTCSTVDDFKELQRMYSDASKNARMLAVEFGLTPSSAGKVQMPKKDTKSKLQKFLTQ